MATRLAGQPAKARLAAAVNARQPGAGGPGSHLSRGYVERCQLARLRRWPDRVGRESLVLRRGDLYAWREASLPEALISLVAEPRLVVVDGDRLWWVPRLDELLERVELAARERWPEELTQVLRERIARCLAEQLRERQQSWEEAALDLLLAGW